MKLELVLNSDLPAPTCQVLELQAGTTTPGLLRVFSKRNL